MPTAYKDRKVYLNLKEGILVKRSVTIQDISCFGKCSITVALPIMSAMGVETAIIPTAVLSTHTGGFTGFTLHDLTDEIEPISRHWMKEGITFDSIYTGYLATDRQISIVSDFFDSFGENALKFVDPVMGDNGRLYTGFDAEFAKKMAGLCAKADIIVPNLTEAAFMLGEEYVGREGYSKKYIEDLLVRLCTLGCRVAIITGVILEKDGEKKHGAVAYDSESGRYFEYFAGHVEASFHGTGDCFSASLCGALTRGDSIENALKIAVDYTVAAINATVDDREKYWYGVNFEKALSMLTEKQ